MVTLWATGDVITAARLNDYNCQSISIKPSTIGASAITIRDTGDTADKIIFREDGSATFTGGADIGASKLLTTSLAIWEGMDDRLFIRNRAADAFSVVLLMPRGSPVGTTAAINIFNTDFAADSVNFERLQIDARGTEYIINVGKAGTGSLRPLKIRMDENDIITITTGLGIELYDRLVYSLKLGEPMDAGNNAINFVSSLRGTYGPASAIEFPAGTGGRITINTPNSVGAITERMVFQGLVDVGEIDILNANLDMNNNTINWSTYGVNLYPAGTDILQTDDNFRANEVYSNIGSRPFTRLTSDGRIIMETVLADATTTLQDSKSINLIGQYWTGTASSSMYATIFHRMLSTTPTSELVFQIAGTDLMKIKDTGEIWTAVTRIASGLSYTSKTVPVEIGTTDTDRAYIKLVKGATSLFATLAYADSDGYDRYHLNLQDNSLVLHARPVATWTKILEITSGGILKAFKLISNLDGNPAAGLEDTGQIWMRPALADATTTLRDSPPFTLTARYWDGTTSVNRDAAIYHDIWETTPRSTIVFQIAGVDLFKIHDDKSVDVFGTLRPSPDNTIDLGSSANRWNQGFFGKVLVTPSVDGMEKLRVGRADGTRLLDINTSTYAVWQGVLNLQGIPADSATTLTHSPVILLRGYYWDGTASVLREARIGHYMLSTGPTSELVFQIEGTDYFKIGDNGYIIPRTNPFIWAYGQGKPIELRADDNVTDTSHSFWLRNDGVNPVIGWKVGELHIGVASVGYINLRRDTIAWGSIRPEADDLRDLGTSTYRWRDAWFSGIVTIDRGTGSTGLFSRAEGVGRLRVGAVWGMPGLYSGDDGIYNLVLGAPEGAEVILRCGPDSYFVSGTAFYPGADNTFNLGSTSYRWKDGYIVNLYTGDITLDNGMVITEDSRGVIFKSPRGEELMKLDMEGNLYVKGEIRQWN